MLIKVQEEKDIDINAQLKAKKKELKKKGGFKFGAFTRFFCCG
jgi:hypothetical protein